MLSRHAYFVKVYGVASIYSADDLLSWDSDAALGSLHERLYGLIAGEVRQDGDACAVDQVERLLLTAWDVPNT